MSQNTLYKEIAKSYVSGTPGVAADPGQPYLPARTISVQQTVCRPMITVVGSRFYAGGYDPMWLGGGAAPGYRPDQTLSGSATVSGMTCFQRTVKQSVPAQPYIPPTVGRAPTEAQIVQDFNLGWTGRARSIAAYAGAVEVTFKVPRSSVGVVVGLNTESHSTGYRDIRFAFYLSRGAVRILESGEQQAVLPAQTGGETFKIRRLNGEISYFVNDALVRSTPNDAAPMHLDAALYSGGDTVDEPTITPLSAGSAAFEPLDGMAGLYAAGIAAFEPLESSAGMFSRGAVAFEPLTSVASDYAYGHAEARFEPFVSTAYTASLVPSYAIADGVFVQLSSSASGLTGEIGTGQAGFEPLVALASEGSYGEGGASFEPMDTFAYGLSGAELLSLGLYSASIAGSRANVMIGVGIRFDSRMRVATLIEVFRNTTEALHSMVQASSTLTVSVQSWVELFSRLKGRSSGFSLAMDGDLSGLDTWVLNAESGGFTRYENYPYSSFAKVGDTYYGCKADGIYALDGDTDAGAAIRAMVSFGKQDFGTSALKRITNAYVGVSCEGRMFLKVIAEGEEYVYAARSADEELQVQRFDTGKGLRVNYLEFELYNADGEYFELASVEFAVVPTSRRI